MSLAMVLQSAARAFLGISDTANAQTAGFLIGVTQKEAPARSSLAYLEAYSQMPHLRNICHRIADSIATAPYKLVAVKRSGRFQRIPEMRMAPSDVRQKILRQEKQAGNLVEIEDHPLLHALSGRFNTVLTGYSLRFLTQVYLDILGESFWLKDRNAQNAPIAFYPLPPTWIQQTPSASDPQYWINKAAFQKSIPATEILWLKDPDPVNPYGRGSGVAQSLADELDIDEYAARMMRMWFLNDSLPSAIVSPGDGQGAGKDSIDRLREQFRNEHQGFWRRFRIHFSTRKIDVHQLSHTFRDQQLPEIRNQERDIIFQTLNIPPEVLGINENSNRATIDAAQYLYALNVVQPRLERTREQLQEWLIPEYEDPEKLFFEYDSPVPEDKEHALAVAKAQPQAMTQNEWRQMAGLEPAPTGEVYHIPFNVVPQATLGGMPQRESGQRGAANSSRRLTHSEPPLLKAIDPVDDEFYLLVHQVADRLIPGLQRRFREVILAARESIDLGVLEDALRRRLAQNAEGAIPWNDIREAFRESANTAFRQAVLASGEGAASELGSMLGVGIGFNVASPRVATFAEAHSALLVTRIEEPTRQAVRNAISRVFQAEGATAQTAAREIRDTVGLLPRQESALANFRASLVDQGVSDIDIARRVQRMSDAMLRQRASMIARTEIIDAANEGQQQLWQQAAEEGILDTNRARRFWLVTPDDRLDMNICEPIPELNRDGVGLTQPFVTPSGEIMRPTAHPGCRCAVTLRFP